MSLYSSPAYQQRSNNNGSNNPRSSSSSGNSSSSSRTMSLDQDPIVRLLRAPRRQPPPPRDANKFNDVHNYYSPPTFLDALSAETMHRPSVRFPFPLAGLSFLSHPLAEDWKTCFWNEFEREAKAQAAAAVSPTARGGFGSRGGAPLEEPPNKREENQPLGVEGKENATRILLRLLSGGMKDQMGLQSHFRQTYNQHHPLVQGQQPNFGSPSPLKQRSHGRMMNLGHQTPQRNNAPGSIMEPNLELTMMEYYLFLFVRFPLANTFWDMQLQEQQRRQRRVAGQRIPPPFGQRLYSNLLMSYMNYYLPQGRVYDRDRLGVGVDCFDGTASDRTSELFLRLILELWVQGPNIAPTTNDAIARYCRVRDGVSSSSSSLSLQSTIHPSLSDSLELAQPAQQAIVKSPPYQVQTGILSLVRHLVSDKSMRELVRDVSLSVQQRQREDRGGAATPTLVDDAGSERSSSQSNNVAVSWCLPPAITASQPSIFNYIRLGLACGAIHDPSSIFHWALESWLIWMEPWNYIMKRRAVNMTRSSSDSGPGRSNGISTHRAGEFLRNAAATVSSHHRVEYYPSYVRHKPTSPSAYSAQWEAYVVSNAHFYTVPLAIFLKRARELDFSSTVEYPKSLALVQRVLRVYSKAVVNVLNGVLNQRADALSASLFDRHGANMHAFRPPNAWKLVECQLDATNLLEEVFSQHQKRRARMDAFDRIEAKLNALFDGKIGSEEAALENLLSQVRYLVNLPLDYEVLPEEPRTKRGSGLWRLLGLESKDATMTASGAISENLLGPDRGPDGRLTDVGRQQIYAGLRKCNPMDVHYIGDPMLARVKSYEISVLVDLTIFISQFLNRKLGLVEPAPDGGVGVTEDSELLKKIWEMEQYQKVAFRFNFRFLADSRNIIFATIVWWLVKTIGGFFTN